MALYLKYRPQNLDQIIGQTQVKQILQGALLTGKLSHAYLFSGPRGTGKTSTARILAKMVNCENKNAPCNQCSTCLSITDGSNLDLIEIDAASNRGIDDIRSLRETIKLAPSSSKKKVYIIDEVHMLTTEAFNALLKTLEEPPAHALFILATTELQKVPATILSRVTKLDFKLATAADMMQALTRVVDGEKINIGAPALRLISKKADGSFRDGVKLLDQLASKGAEIKLKDVESLTGGNFEMALHLLEKISNKDSGEALTTVVRQTEAGVQIKNFVLLLMEILRALVFIKNGLGPSLVKEEYGSDQYQKLDELSIKFSVSDLVKALDKLQEALEKLKITSIPSLPLEIAVVEICGESQLRQKLDVGSEKLDKQSLLSDESKEVRSSKLEEDQTSNIQPHKPSSNLQHPTSSGNISKLTDKWTFVLETVRQNNFSLEALLRSAKIVDCRDGKVIVEVPYAFHQRILEQPKSKDLLEAVLSDVLSQPIKVVTVLGSRPQRIEDVANIELAAEDEIITLASEIFNGKLVD